MSDEAENFEKLLDSAAVIGESLLWWAKEMDKFFAELEKIKKHPNRKGTSARLTRLKNKLDALIKRGDNEIEETYRWQKSLNDYKKKPPKK